MGIILLEPPDSCQTAQRAAGLVPVEDAKVGKTERQLLVTPFLQPDLVTLHENEHVINM
jgi:hypothetical protein